WLEFRGAAPNEFRALCQASSEPGGDRHARVFFLAARRLGWNSSRRAGATASAQAPGPDRNFRDPGARAAGYSSPSRVPSRSWSMPTRTPEPGGTQVNVVAWPGWVAASRRLLLETGDWFALSGT